ncbi:M10 family metallopeptidase C-terminal domain-containing protein [Pseudomonas azerbaijanoccidentalis]
MPRPTGYTDSWSSSLTGLKPVDSLISGSQWESSKWYDPGAATHLTFSFAAPGVSYFAINYSADNEYTDMYALTTAQQNAVVSALGAWSAVANITFTQTTDNVFGVGDLRFAGYAQMDGQTAAWAYLPSDAPRGGDVWIGPQTNSPTPTKGSYDYLTFVHEIGHAIGLKHPFSPNPMNSTVLDPLLDDVALTVMSYNDSYSYQPTTPMLLDILAIQSLYGANTQWMTGNTVYSWAPTQSVFETIWDAGGVDTIDGRNQLAAVRIDLNEGAFSQIGQAFTNLNDGSSFNEGLAIAYGAKIENAMGSDFDDVLIGNSLNNLLNGSAGADTMSGGAGNDTYVVDNAGDAVIELGSSLSEIDTVIATIDYTLGANLENLTLFGPDNINGTGNALNNVMIGNAGNNVIDGGLGADTMTGGAGNDTYIVDNLADTVVELTGGGQDLVKTSVSYTLSANIEDAQAQGNAALTLIGNALNNTLTGNAAANILNGGTGADTLIGGAGNDLYVVDNLNDVVVETSALSTEIDTVVATINYTLGANLENLTLYGPGNLNGTGNALNNVMLGNAGNNSLQGGAGNDLLDGGLGADILIGGADDDIYIVDNAADTIVELAGEGHDLVKTSINYTLSANIEDALAQGAAALSLIGNALDNTLTGNAAANILNGGAGADTLIGGAGNDLYVVDNLNDVVVETSALASEIDTVVATIDYTLGANLENLTLFGPDNINGTGNALNNVMIGNAGNNVIDGGLGADTMTGGAGNDTYIVDNVNDVVVETSALASEIDTVVATVNYTLGANLENLTFTGSANLNGMGNTLNNVITGNAGNNILNGGLGADILKGGAGNDIYFIDNAADTIVELTGEGHDLVKTTVSHTLSANVEDALALGNTALTLIGNNLDNTLTGNDAANILNGGAGADILIGGAGNDLYVVDNVNDVVVETSTLASEIDTVVATTDYTLGANLENLTLFGPDNINGTGNALNNVMIGNAGNNVLDGGLGADTMTGGAGDDVYIIDILADTVVELAGEGHDLVKTSINYTLSANIEDALAQGAAALTLIGNALDNTLTGNAAANILNGGAGADTLIGGAGNDLYVVDNINDVVVETSALSTEIDTVVATIDYTLGANLENLTLFGPDNINGTGNALNNVMIGNAGNNVIDGGLGADTMTGGAGNDTYIVDNVNDVVVETSALASEIDTVVATVNYTLGANLENLTFTGSANLNGMGNTLNNVITGNAGNNILNGGLGADTLRGGAGDDIYFIDNAADTIVELAGEGHDLVKTSINYTLSANIEDALAQGAAALTLIGNALDNTLTGNAAANILNGGAGADTLIGGAGNDLYVVDNLNDVVVETSALASEIDTVVATIDYTLGANLENLTLFGPDNINGTGNALNNVMIGNAGNNVIDGGLGADTMTGGAGNDTYIVDNVNDVVVETSALASEIDTVVATVNYTLGANLENLTFTGSANLNGMGNTLNNVITGNAGNNILNGGLGADILKGGAGNDIYFIDNAADTIVELTGEGHDLVKTTVSHTLSANVEDALALGNTALTLIGNNLDNTLTGNDAANILNGGAGADILIGGAGNDLYVVDNVNDVVVETSTLASEIDTVVATTDYTLGANLENLTLFGPDNINGTGNALNNVMIGNAGNNVLDGGIGADILTGGAGADVFVFNALNEVGKGNLRDVITDFSSLDGDKIDFSKFDANLLSAGINGFSFINSSEFTAAGQLRFVDHVLYGNVNGDLGADFEIQLVGVNSFSANDLVV